MYPDKITKEDKELAEAAKKRAGGPGALAKMFGVTPPAASEWGRTRPIPRHLRPRLETFIGSTIVPEASAAGTGSTSETVTGPRAVHELMRLLHPDSTRSRVAHLSQRAQRRYEERVAE